MNVLIGDIGGTKTILAVFSSDQGPHDPLVEIKYHSAQYPSLEAIISEFLAECSYPIDQACFGVAGPVVEGNANITNLSWTIETEKVKTAFNLRAVTLINDMVALANSISVLQPEDVEVLRSGKPVKGTAIAILAPGTGLGEGFLVNQDGVYVAQPSEGSHASFAPMTETQISLLRFAQTRGYEHVSVERVCSGGLGIPLLYDFYKSAAQYPEPTWLAEQLADASDPTPVIIKAALNISQPAVIARAVLRTFVDILGAEAGNLALKTLSTGGIYLGGGIPPHILNQLKQPGFLEAVNNKGRFTELLSNIPVYVIMNSKAGLLGAAFVGLSQT